MKTAVGAADRPPGHICWDTHPEGPDLRCWKRDGHDGPHLTVFPNRASDVCTRPQVARW